MKVGVIGCGGMGTTHYLSLKVLSSQMDVEVVALADCREEFLQKAAAEFPEARTYTYGMELIERENLDAVHICLPSYLHTEHAVAAMKKGMNVLVEKPVCLTREEGELLLETQKETGVKVMVGQVVRAFDEYRYLKEVYDNKTLGKLKSIVMQRVSGNVRWGFEGWFHDEKKRTEPFTLIRHDSRDLRYTKMTEQRSFRNFIRSMKDRRIPVSTSRTSDHIIQRSSIFWNVCRMEKKSLSRRFRKA